MGATPPTTLAFTIQGPIARADLPGVCDRLSALLTESGADVVLCDVCDVEPDAVTVDALARLQLAAQRTGCQVQLRGGSQELCALVEFMGLADVLCVGRSVENRKRRRGTPMNDRSRSSTDRFGTSRRALAPLRPRERIVKANGVDLCVETFGDAANPAVLLIAGAASSMDWWEDEFCERLASGGRSVVRYDLRDTGRSVTYPPGSPGYGGLDLAADAVGVLDALGIDSAHIVGISMGGGIAQRLALDHSDRVASLTLMSTSTGDPDLPPMSDELAAAFAAEATEPDWSDRDAVIEYIVEGLRPFAGSYPVDAERARALASRIVDRTVDIASTMTNHWILEGGGEPMRPRLHEIAVPTLVLHGTEDPLFPFPHGEALAAEIPGARLLPLPGVGHEHPPPPVWDLVVTAIVEHTAPAGR